MGADLLQVESVTYRYGESEWELGPVGFSLRAGEVLAIIGPNGSGKSTLLKVAAGVLPPLSGSVRLAGNDTTGMDRRDMARFLGYLPQQVAYAFDYTVEEVVSMGRFPHLTGMGFLGAADLRVLERSMAQTGTLAFRGRTISHLSGGERQRVLLASVLAQEPRVLLLDEPTSALDIHHQAEFFRLLRRFAREANVGVAVVLHDLNVASFYCDRLLMLAGGRALCEGVANDVLRADRLSTAYGENIRVEADTQTGRPIILPGAAEAVAGRESP